MSNYMFLKKGAGKWAVDARHIELTKFAQIVTVSTSIRERASLKLGWGIGYTA
jgi:hypothetical protein